MFRQQRYLIVIGLLCLVSSSTGFAATHIRLFLNPGEYIAVDSTTYPYYAFNNTATFDPQNEVLTLQTGDTAIFTILNTDTLTHGFALKGYPGSGGTMAPLDSLQDTVICTTPGLFIYYDNFDFPTYTYLGAAGMLLVESANTLKHFYWNFKEQQDLFSTDLANGQSVDWTQYEPNYFTVNSRGKPDIPDDSTAVIIADVGDTVRILMANTGRSAHSIHFHGFHTTITYASQDARWVNGSKDTCPLKSMETMILEMVPDKPGFYPVHDHNLIAVSGGGYYPNGIFMMMKIN